MDLASMKRWDLQALCKRHGLAGGGTNADLVARLSAALTGSGGRAEQAVEVWAGKGCLKQPAGDSSSGGSGAGKKVTFVFEGGDDREVEVAGTSKGRRGNRQVMRSRVVAKTKRVQKAGQTIPGADLGGVERHRTRAQAAGDSADRSDAGKAGTGAPVRRSSRNVVNVNAGNEVEMVPVVNLDAGNEVVTQNNTAKAVEEEEKVGEAVDRKRKRKTWEHDEVADVSGQVGVSRRSTRSSGLVSALAPVSSPAGDKKRGRRKAGDVTEQTCVQEQISEVQHVGRTLRSGLVVVGPVSPIVSESKRSRRKLQEEEPAAKVAKLEISGRTTRSTSVAASVTYPIVVEKKGRKTELHSDGEPHTVPKLPITAAPVTRVLRSRAVQVSDSTVEETHFDKQLQSKRQPGGPSTRNRRNKQVAFSVEEGSQEQVAPPCVAPPLRRSGRNHSEGDTLLNNNTTSESNKQSRAPMEGNALNIARLSLPNATRDGKEDGVAKAEGALECKKKNPRNSRTMVARNGSEIQISDSSGKAKAIETEPVVAEPVRKSRRDSVVPTLLEKGDKGKRGNIRGQELQNVKDTNVENQPTVKEPVRRSTRKSLVSGMLEKNKNPTAEIIPEAQVRRSTRKSVLPAMREKERNGLTKESIPDAHVVVRRSMQKSDLPGILNDENNDYGKKRIAEIGGIEKQLGVEEPVRRLTRKSVVPAALEKGNKGLHIKMKSEAPVKRSVRNPVAPNMVDKGNNDCSEIFTMEESGVRTRNSQTRLQFAIQNDAGQQRTTRKSSKLVISQIQSKSAASKGRPAKRARRTVLHMPLEEPNADDMVGEEATHDSEKVTQEIVHIQEIRQVNPTVEEFPSAPLLETLLEDTDTVLDLNEEIHEPDSGFAKSSHEEEQVTSGMLVFLEAAKCSEKITSDEVACEDEENKEHTNYINSSREQSDGSRPGVHAYCITDASLDSSLIAPANNNDELHHGSDLSRLEVTDSLDEPTGCSKGEALQQVLQEQCEVLHVPVEDPNGDATVTREARQDGDEVTQEEGLKEQGEVLHMPVEETNADGTVIKEAMQDGDEVTNELGFEEQCEVLHVPVEEPNDDSPVIGETIQDGDEVTNDLGFKEQSEVLHVPVEEPNCDATVIGEAIHDGDEITHDLGLKEQSEVMPLPVEEPNADVTIIREAMQDGDEVTYEQDLKAQGEALHMPVEEPNADGTIIKEAMQDGDEVTHDLGPKEQCEVLHVPVEEPNDDAIVIGVAIQDGDEVTHVSGLKEQSEVIHLPVEETNVDVPVIREAMQDGDEVTHEQDLKGQGEVLHMPVEEPNADGTIINKAMQDGDEVTNELGLKEQCEVFHVPVEEPNADATVIGEAIQDGDEVIHDLGLKEQSEVMHLPIEEPNADFTVIKEVVQVGDEVTPKYIEVSPSCTLEIRQVNIVEEEPTSAPFLGTLHEDPQKVQIMNEEIHESEPGLTKSTHEEDQVASDQIVFLEAAYCIERTNFEEVVYKDEENKKPINCINSSCELTDANRPGCSSTEVPQQDKGLESGDLPFPAKEKSNLQDARPNSELECAEVVESGLSCDKGISNSLEIGSSVDHVDEQILSDSSLPEDCSMDHSVEESRQESPIHVEDSDLVAEDKSFSRASGISEAVPIDGSESTKPLMSDVETSTIPDEQPNTELEGDEFKEDSLSCGEDSVDIVGTGFVNNEITDLAEGCLVYSCQEQEKILNDLSARKSPEKSAICQVEKSNIMLEVNKKHSPTCHGGNDYISNAGSVGNNMPAPKSPEDSVIRLDNSILASEGICQTSGRRRVDEISTQLLSFKISSAVKGSYIAMDTPSFAKQEDNSSQSAIAFLGNTRDTPAAETNPPKLNTDHSVAKDSPTQVLPGNVELAVNNPDNILAVEQVHQDDVDVQECILEKTSSGSATPECKHQSRLPEEAVLHSTGNDKCPSSVEQTPFGLRSLFSQENIEEPMGHGASEAMELLQQDDVHVQEGTLEKTSVVSAKPEEIELHSMKNEGCSSRVEQSPFGLQSLFSQEIMEEPVEYEAPGSAKFEGEDGVQGQDKIEKTPSPDTVSDHETQVDLGVVSNDGDCVHTCQQDNEKEGLTEPSHEQEQVAFGQVQFHYPVNQTKKDANSEENPAIGKDQMPPGDSLYELDSLDFMDEHVNYLKEQSDEDNEG